MEFEVWLSNGTRVTSLTHKWEEVPHGVLAVRYWGNNHKGINWGDGLYGDPATHKHAGMVSDEEFQRVMEEVRETTVPPSQR